MLRALPIAPDTVVLQRPRRTRAVASRLQRRPRLRRRPRTSWSQVGRSVNRGRQHSSRAGEHPSAGLVPCQHLYLAAHNKPCPRQQRIAANAGKTAPCAESNNLAA